MFRIWPNSNTRMTLRKRLPLLCVIWITSALGTPNLRAWTVGFTPPSEIFIQCPYNCCPKYVNPKAVLALRIEAGRLYHYDRAIEEADFTGYIGYLLKERKIRAIAVMPEPGERLGDVVRIVAALTKLEVAKVLIASPEHERSFSQLAKRSEAP